MLRNCLNNIQSKAFEKNLPSAFIVGSPLQLLCAVEAINEFDIEEYKIVLLLIHNWSRNGQLISMADALRIDYEILYSDTSADELFDDSKNQYKIECKGKYDRIFVGDNRFANKYYPIPLYAKKGAVVAYLDDGNSTIMVLNGVFDDQIPKNWRKRLNWLKNNRKKKIDAIIRDFERIGIIDTRCFYTIYSDIKSNYYCTYPNSFKHLLATNSALDKRNVVLVIGGITDILANEYEIRASHMEAITWIQLSKLRNEFPEEEIIYVPHGRDVNEVIPLYCDILNIQYKRLDETIETYCINENLNPITIRGFLSTAQSSLKILYPSADVRFWRIRFGNFDRENKASRIITTYYKRHGIIEELIWLNTKSRNIRNTWINNIHSILMLIKDKLTRIIK